MMSDLKNILIAGNPTNAGVVLVRKYLEAGHTVKVQEGFIYRNDIIFHDNMDAICNDNVNLIDDDFGNKEKLREIVTGCNVIIYFAQTGSEHESKFDYDAFISMVDNARDCGVQRFIYVSSDFINDALYVEYLKKNALDNLTVIIVNDSEVDSNQSEQKREISVEVISKCATDNHKIALFGKKQKDVFKIWLSGGWYSPRDVKSDDSYADCKAELYLALSELPANKLERKVWPYIVTYRSFLNQADAIKKVARILRNPYASLHGRIIGEKGEHYKVRRIFDMLAMMFLIHFWPEQTYRFSTRKLLPPKERRYRVSDRPIIPCELVASRTSDIPRMKEINIVLRGSSFDPKQLDKLTDLPTFLVSFWEPVQTKKEVTYVMGRSKNALRLGKLGHKVIHNEVCMMDYDGNITPSDFSHKEPPWYKQFVEDGTCKRISILENLYYGVPKPPYPVWAPLTSGIHGIISLSYFAEKINVYGWDFYLESSPDSMSYWQLYSHLCNNLVHDITVAIGLLEVTITNLYYGYLFSKLPNINIHGYLGQLGQHEKLIGKLERVLFNP
jgi:nucleoside-diphosphate-sugar epimerase